MQTMFLTGKDQHNSCIYREICADHRPLQNVEISATESQHDTEYQTPMSFWESELEILHYDTSLFVN